MKRVTSLIIGGGMAADAAARGVRELDADGTIGILSADLDAPYTRPALTKKLWTDPQFTWEQVPLNTVEDTGADLRLRTLVTSLDADAHCVRTEDGEDIRYDRLLVATGVRPRTLEGSDPAEDPVLYFRTARDYRLLRSLVAPGTPILVIGGGYIGAELAAALTHEHAQVTLVTPDDVLGGSQFPETIAQDYQQMFLDAGVHIVTGRHVPRARRVDGETVAVTLDDGTEVTAASAVAGLGTAPVTELAERAGVAVDDGIIVDARLRTSMEDIWAAGDVASYRDALLGRRRVEHVDNARHMGRAAGRSMAGAPEPYSYTPMMYSQVFGVRWEAVGTLDASLETVEVPVGEGRVVYYLDDRGAPRGVLLWDLSERTDQARRVIAGGPIGDAALAAAIR